MYKIILICPELFIHFFQFIDKKYQGGHYYVYDIARNNGDSFTKVCANLYCSELLEFCVSWQ